MKHSDIRLVVCDIDDTLIHKELNLSEDVIRMIKILRSENIGFTFATGRMPYRVDVFAKEAELDIPYIANNGSILYDRGRAVYESLMKASGLRDTLRKFMYEYPEFTVIFSYEDRECPVVQTNWVRERLHKYKGYAETLGDTDEVWNQEVHKIYVLDDERSGLISKVAKQLEAFGDEFSYYQYGEYSIEIVAPGCSKASGLKKLIEYMQLDASQVMAIGDHTNDIEMVQLAGMGIAVSNADPKLKCVADYITGGERSAGVIEAINRFVFQTEEDEDEKKENTVSDD